MNLYMRIKTNLKWYQKLFNILTGHKDRNYDWVLIGNGKEIVGKEIK